MLRTVLAAALALPLAVVAQEEAGTLTLKLADAEAPQEQPFVVIQGAKGANPGSRYSRLGGDVVMTIVGVLGEEPREPEEADATVELRFTVDGTGPEVRTGSVLSYSTRDAAGMPTTRGGTVEIALADLVVEEDRVIASGTFSAQLPPDAELPNGEVEGTFQTAMKSRDALD